MKVNVISAKGLETNLNVVIDKKDLEKKIDQRLDEVKKDINLKGFRPSCDGTSRKFVKTRKA